MNKTKSGRGDDVPGSLFDAADDRLSTVPALLLSWYDQNARVLSWRSNPTPYRVWISEMMLQQTRVEAVKGYFERFITALPDVYALACVSDDALLKLWEGLGYYSRAKNLKRAAGIIVSQYGGELPADPALLRELPGIGEYSSGSIASIAFGVRAPAVDGNVLRVISRLLASEADVTSPAVRRDLTALVARLLPQERVGDFNQSLMELGATVCLPNGAPLCLLCPVRAICEGNTQGIAAQLPKKSEKKPKRMQQITAFLITKEENLYLRKRPEQGLLAGLWELPNVEELLSPEQADRWLSGAGVLGVTAKPAGTGKHIFTHIVWNITLYAVEMPDGGSFPGDWVEVSPADLSGRYPLPSAFLSLLKNL